MNSLNLTWWKFPGSPFITDSEIKASTKPKPVDSFVDKQLVKFVDWLKSLSPVKLFITENPSTHLLNCYNDHELVKHSMRILSTLASHSIQEDKYGLVQQKLPDILNSLLETLTVLDKSLKHCNNVVITRHQQSMRGECVASVYRVVISFNKQLDSLSLKPEHQNKLMAFSQYKCWFIELIKKL